MCGRHRERERKGIFSESQLKVRPPGSTLARDEFGRKWCKGCGEWLPESMFLRHLDDSKRLRTADGLRVNCKDCMNKQKRDKAPLRAYGLTPEDLEAMMERQGGKCAACRMGDLRDGYVVDHDHACCPGRDKTSTTCGNCVRGLLEANCNTGIGMFRDDPQALRNAADYLENYRAHKDSEDPK